MDLAGDLTVENVPLRLDRCVAKPIVGLVPTLLICLGDIRGVLNSREAEREWKWPLGFGSNGAPRPIEGFRSPNRGMQSTAAGTTGDTISVSFEVVGELLPVALNRA